MAGVLRLDPRPCPINSKVPRHRAVSSAPLLLGTSTSLAGSTATTTSSRCLDTSCSTRAWVPTAGFHSRLILSTPAWWAGRTWVAEDTGRHPSTGRTRRVAIRLGMPLRQYTRPAASRRTILRRQGIHRPSRTSTWRVGAPIAHDLGLGGQTVISFRYLDMFIDCPTGPLALFSQCSSFCSVRLHHIILI
jgi:hypothetical protein